MTMRTTGRIICGPGVLFLRICAASAVQQPDIVKAQGGPSYGRWLAGGVPPFSRRYTTICP